MYSIDDPTAVASLPTPEAAGTEGYFTEGNPGGAIPATLVRASWMNMITQELRNWVVAAGLVPSKTTYNQVLQAGKLMFGATVGGMTNAKMALSAASASATFTADEIIVGTALGGQNFRLASFNKTINLATTGAGGMDTGSAPTGGFVALYAIYNPTTGTAALLATNATSSAQPTVYGGANMPAGYTASALVSVWPTDGTGKLKAGGQVGRQVSLPQALALSSTSTVGAWTSLSLSSIVPANAKSIGGTMSPANSSGSSQNTEILIASDSNGSGRLDAVYALTSASGGGLTTPFAGLLLLTAQTIWYQTATTAGSPTFSIYVSSYTI